MVLNLETSEVVCVTYLQIIGSCQPVLMNNQADLNS